MGDSLKEKMQKKLEGAGNKVSGVSKTISDSITEAGKRIKEIPGDRKSNDWQSLKDLMAQILQDINGHLQFQKEMTEDSGVQEGMIKQFELHEYINRFDKEFLKPLIARHSEKSMEFVEALINTDLSNFPLVDDLLFSQFFNSILELLAKKLKKPSTGALVQDIYNYYQGIENSALKETTLARLKVLLKLYESEFIEKQAAVQAAEEERLAKEEEAREEKARQAKEMAEVKAKKNQARQQQKEEAKQRKKAEWDAKLNGKPPKREHKAEHSENEKQALDMIDGLLFQHGTYTKRKLNKVIRKSNPVFLGMRLGVLAVLFVVFCVYLSIDYKEISREKINNPFNYKLLTFPPDDRGKAYYSSQEPLYRKALSLEWVGRLSFLVSEEIISNNVIRESEGNFTYEPSKGTGFVLLLFATIAFFIILNLSLVRYISYVRYSHPRSSLKKGIAKIYAGTGVSERFLLENLRGRYGKRIIDLLKI